MKQIIESVLKKKNTKQKPLNIKLILLEISNIPRCALIAQFSNSDKATV